MVAKDLDIEKPIKITERIRKEDVTPSLILHHLHQDLHPAHNEKNPGKKTIKTTTDQPTQE
jgi:hypothetical protein